MSTTNTTIPANLTGPELISHILLFCYNWTENDFKQAFRTSSIGWDYHWDKLQGKTRNGHDATAAIVLVILNMDNKHLQLLFQHIFTKGAKTIKSGRQWQEVTEQLP